MTMQIMTETIATSSVKWMARLGSVVSIGLILMFLGGFQPSQVRPREWVGFTFFPIGISIGMLLAWWKERLGGVITVASLLAFYGIYGLLMGSNVRSWAFVVFAAPGFLFVLHSIISRRK